jgi:photosystem II stability/assembly factor-like uncharacterized protein
MRQSISALFLLVFIAFTIQGRAADTTSVTIMKAGKLGGNLAGMDFPTASVGYAVGSDISISTNNFIAKTADGGLTWQRISTAALTDRPQAVRFKNLDTGFVVGYTGMLLRTTNGGATWTNVNNSGYTGTFNDVRFINSSLGYACGTYVTSNGTAVIKTTDGGANWTLAPLGTTNSRNSILALSATEILIAGSSGNIARTTDGGSTWGSVFAGPSTLQSLARMGTNGVVVCGAQRILYKSTDRGATFAPILATGGAGFTLYSVSMADPLNGIAVGSNGLNYRTQNGWATVDSNLVSTFTAQVCRTVIMKSPTEIFVGADQGNILRSSDFGGTWTTIESSTRYYALDFANANSGVAVGWRGTVIKTTNGGLTWTELRGLNGFELYDVKMFDASTFYVAGDAGRFYVTTNGGTSFTERSLPVTNGGASKTLHFLNPQTGFCSGEMGRIYRTSNAGIQWDSVFTFGTTVNNIEDIAYTDDSVGFALGERGRIVRTTNGMTWDSIGIVRPNLLTLWEAQFLTAATGYVTSQNGTIYKTTNGGASWTQQNDTTGLANIDVIDIQVAIPTRRGFATAEQGKLLRLVNENSWRVDRTITTSFGTPDNLWSIDFVDTSRAFISGYYGTIYRLDVTTTTDVSENSAPKNFTLNQNYPNPFNPTTTISYQLPIGGLATLKVFDLLGREVATLVNGFVEAGGHSVHWNASGLSSGLYLCRLSSGNFSDVKKMMLLR